jgi:two-component system osmolarity sensor histidine kinase EnvZ
MPRSLFARTAAIFLALVLAFQILLFSASGYFVVWPLLRNSVNDLAGLMVVSADTWVRLPEGGRASYQEALFQRYQLRILPTEAPIAGEPSVLPYVRLLESVLSERLGRPVEVRETTGDHYVVDLPVGTESVRFDFPRDRIGTNPVVAFVLVAGGSLLLGLVAALLIARGLTRPLARLAQATARVGRSGEFDPLPEDGPEELASLTREFNRMSATVRDLLENRTIMLAGVSHDLRSPITRLRIALELCRSRPTPQLIARMERDLERMDALIGAFLEFSRGVGAEPLEQIDLKALLTELAEEARMHGAAVELHADETCVRETAPLALHRVLANLVENAVRYGEGEPIELALLCERGATVVEVRDRGPGIPEDKREEVFRPFVRLDTSRSPGVGGSGLGLAMVRQIAQAQGWHVTLQERLHGGLIARVAL